MPLINTVLAPVAQGAATVGVQGGYFAGTGGPPVAGGGAEGLGGGGIAGWKPGFVHEAQNPPNGIIFVSVILAAAKNSA